MAFLQFGDVIQNALTLAVLIVVFYWVFMSMKAGKAKSALQNTFSKLKMEREK